LITAIFIILLSLENSFFIQYLYNYSKDTMFFKTEDQEELIEQYEVIKVFDNGL